MLDVCGHGVGSALHGMSALHALRSRGLTGVDVTDPAAVATAMNNPATANMQAGGSVGTRCRASCPTGAMDWNTRMATISAPQAAVAAPAEVEDLEAHEGLDASFVTGQAIAVDGGYTAGRDHGVVALLGL